VSEGFQRAIGKPFGRVRRHETPIRSSAERRISLPAGSDQGFAVALDLRGTPNLSAKNDFTLSLYHMSLKRNANYATIQKDS
jgi:hypothetical protein